MVTGNFKIAMDSIKHARWRSFFTMLGIIIGVVSVVTIVSIGEGVKKQIQGEIDRLGPDLITIRPGKVIDRNNEGQITAVPALNTLVNTPLTELDLKVVSETKNVQTAVPLSYLSGTPNAGDRNMPGGLVFGTTNDLPKALKQNVEYGAFFEKDANKNVAVVGIGVAEKLFRETVPIGNSMQIRGQTFVVIGVFEEFNQISFSPEADYNNAIFIPTDAAKKLNNNTLSIQQIFVRPNDTSQTDTVVDDLRNRLLNAHSGQSDFSILKQEDNLAISNAILNLLTSFITAVAAVSLIVGGIGIMNVMIVSVTERAQEIGVRKAVGATNHQILMQFLIESAAISFVGGIIGVVGSIFVNLLLRIVTDLQPVVTFPIMIAAVFVASVVGIVFGVAPALQAARKDPIDALRRV